MALLGLALAALAGAAFAKDPPPADLAPFLKTPSQTRVWGEPVVVPRPGARTFTGREMEAWTWEIAQRVDPALRYEMVDFDEFKARLRSQGLRPRFAPDARFPVADVAPDGRVTILRDFCNDGTFSEESCRGALFRVVSRIGIQRRQWARLRASRADEADFLSLWNDRGHRRCRGLEVSVSAVLDGVDEPGSLRGAPSADYAACRRSSWAGDFSDSLAEFARLTSR
jgi:hypothetical protein